MHLPAARVSASPAPAAATRSPEAYDRYLRALAALEPVSGIYAACCGTPSLEDLRNVEQLLTQAIALDRDFADAYAVRAGIRGAIYGWNFDTSEAQLRSSPRRFDGCREACAAQREDARGSRIVRGVDRSRL